MVVVNHLSFIGTPQDVEEFRLMCRVLRDGRMVDFSLAGLIPARPFGPERVEKWGCCCDAESVDPQSSRPVPEVTLTQYTAEFSTEGAAPHQWQRVVMQRWPKAHVTIVSIYPFGDRTEVIVYMREKNGDIGARVWDAEDTEVIDSGEEWEDM